MSYDLVVFDAAVAPHDRGAFEAWFGEQTGWREDHSYDDPAVCTTGLRAWFFDIIERFPPMNGPYVRESTADYDPDDDPRMTDYAIGRHLIQAGFAYSESEAALESVMELSDKHGLGIVSFNEKSFDAFLPDGTPI
jgi:hypothetical protein